MRGKILAVLLAGVLLAGGCGAAQQTSSEMSAAQITEDGTYRPGTFRWSGGSGRVQLSCDQVTIVNGSAEAEITFSSPYYEYARIGDTKLDGVYTEDTSTFSVPVELDQETELIGCTTAMSEPHEITYTVYISLEADDESQPAANDNDASDDGVSAQERVREAVREDVEEAAPEIDGLVFERQMELQYAKCFDVFYYQNGYKVLSVPDGSRYLLVPEGMDAPDQLPEDLVVIHQNPDCIYMAATAAMSLFSAIDSLDAVKFTGTDVDGWAITAPREALQNGSMQYAGKYSAPDYELLLNAGCDLAIESTMILHAPDVKEQLNRLGIPVLTDWSGYESSVLGRMEWIRAYGALMNREDAAEECFQKEIASVDMTAEAGGKTIAYFSISSGNLALVPGNEDYIVQMLESGGADYAFSGIEQSDQSSASLRISLEELYASAVDADIIIYNGTISNDVNSLDTFLSKYELMADFRAVKEGQVYVSDRTLYQSTDCAIEFINDVRRIQEGDTDHLKFLEKLN